MDEQRAADVSRINVAAHGLLGVDVSVLRCLRDDPTGAVRQQVHDLDVHTAGWAPPPHGTWLTRPELDGALLARPEHRAILDEWFRDRRARPRSLDGRDWALPGWRDEATAWAERELARSGLPGIERIEQIRVWEFSHVMRLQTAAGAIFLKARAQGGQSELFVTEYLARHFPASMPAVIAIDAERRWLLMRAAEGPELMDVGDPSRWEQTAETCARVQIECIDRVEDLRTLGCPARPLEWLEAEISPLLDDTAALQPADAKSLTDEEIAKLRGLSGELQAMCRALALLRVPLSLEHGDLWGVNVIAGESGPVLIDWEDASLAHPFFSVYLLLASLDYTDALAEVPDARARIRAAYLGPWRAHAVTGHWPAERLERAFDMAQRLAAVHYAVQFRRFALPLIETSWEVRAFAPLFLRALLRMMRADGTC